MALMTNGNPTPQFIDLFAGCGGLSLGLMEAGWTGLFAIEKSPMAFKTLKHNLIGKKDKYRNSTSK
jgi:DNA (cytosine-5)-methyltransferase 1